MKGRKPKPIETHLQNGNPSRLNLSAGTLLSKKIDRERPDPPAHFDSIARDHWNKIIPQLERMGTLAKIDFGSLEALCLIYSNMTRAARDIKKIDNLFYKTPNGSLQQIPQVGILNSAAGLYKGFAAELGLTPSARTRIAGGDQDENSEDEMDAILDGKKTAADILGTGKRIKLKDGEPWRQ